MRVRMRPSAAWVLLPRSGLVAAPLVVEMGDPALRLVPQQLDGRTRRPRGQRGADAQPVEPVAQHRVRVFEVAEAAQRLAQAALREGLPAAAGRAACASGRTGPPVGRAPSPAPSGSARNCCCSQSPLSASSVSAAAATSPPRSWAAMRSASYSSWRASAKVRATKRGDVPREEALGQGRHRAGLARQALVQPAPARAGAVDPGRETAMVAAQVPVFMRQHREQARLVQRHQQRQADRVGGCARRPACPSADAGRCWH
jgi:hypothetical protein